MAIKKQVPDERGPVCGHFRLNLLFMATARRAMGRAGMRTIRAAGLRRLRSRLRRLMLTLPGKGRRAQREQANASHFHQCIHRENI